MNLDFIDVQTEVYYFEVMENFLFFLFLYSDSDFDYDSLNYAELQNFSIQNNYYSDYFRYFHSYLIISVTAEKKYFESA